MALLAPLKYFFLESRDFLGNFVLEGSTLTTNVVEISSLETGQHNLTRKDTFSLCSKDSKVTKSGSDASLGHFLSFCLGEPGKVFHHFRAVAASALVTTNHFERAVSKKVPSFPVWRPL